MTAPTTTTAKSADLTTMIDTTCIAKYPQVIRAVRDMNIALAVNATTIEMGKVPIDTTIKGCPEITINHPEQILNGPCNMHYTYVDGKKVSNHLMKVCRTFIKLQEAVGSKQAQVQHQGYAGTHGK
jgi:hypothetical protein